MPKKISTEPIMIIRYGSKVAGWIGVPGGRLYGDADLTRAAQEASDIELEVSLFDGQLTVKADINYSDNLIGVYAAFASYDKERMRIIKCPDSLLTKLGISQKPEVELYSEDPKRVVYVIDNIEYSLPLSQASI